MKLMKIQLMLTAAAALLLGGCTSYEGSYGSRTYDRGYHDTGGYYAGRDRDYYNGDGYYDSGDRGYYDRTNVREVHTNATVVHERGATGSHATASHTTVSHGASATVSHGHGNKAAVSQKAMNQPQTAHDGGKHPRSDKTPKPAKKTE
jgi:hypothetical protein